MPTCEHCGFEIKFRNPSGFCDHLYYPEHCNICSTQQGKITVSREGLERLQSYIILGEYPKAIGMLSTILVQGVDSDTAS